MDWREALWLAGLAALVTLLVLWPLQTLYVFGLLLLGFVMSLAIQFRLVKDGDDWKLVPRR
jgi:hypothetical protein